MTNAEFYNLHKRGCRVTSASSDVGGTLPVAAVQFCPPVQTGSSIGYYLYPPRSFALHWDGSRSRVSWTTDEESRPDRWVPLDGGVDAFLPRTPDSPIPATAPQREAARNTLDMSRGAPFISASPRLQDHMEITTGIIAKTPPGYGLLVRPPAGIPSGRGAFLYDGFLETDWYRSYIPLVLRLTSTDPVIFPSTIPLAQLQVIPIPGQAPPPKVTKGLEHWPDSIWQEFFRQRTERNRPGHTPGSYGRASRRYTRDAKVTVTQLAPTLDLSPGDRES